MVRGEYVGNVCGKLVREHNFGLRLRQTTRGRFESFSKLSSTLVCSSAKCESAMFHCEQSTDQFANGLCRKLVCATNQKVCLL